MNRSIRFLALLVGLIATSAPAKASGEAMFSKGHSTWTVTGVNCSTGTSVQISAALSGFQISAYRIQNQDSADAVWIGHNTNVSTQALSGLGEKITAGSNAVWELGRNPDIALPIVGLWCRAADAAGATGVTLSRATFGYK